MVGCTNWGGGKGFLRALGVSVHPSNLGGGMTAVPLSDPPPPTHTHTPTGQVRSQGGPSCLPECAVVPIAWKTRAFCAQPSCYGCSGTPGSAPGASRVTLGVTGVALRVVRWLHGVDNETVMITSRYLCLVRSGRTAIIVHCVAP